MSPQQAATSIFLYSLVLVVAACASRPQIRADSDPSVNLASYRTFAFFDSVATEQSPYTTMLTSRLKASAQRELERRGYRKVDADPQLLVNFNVNVQERADIRSTPTPAPAGFYGYRAGMYGMWTGYPQDVQTIHYKEGTLAIDVVDAAKKQLVWQGIAEGRINKSAFDDPEAAIDRVVGEIFAKYPVPAAAPAQSPTG
jgi:hypothetical protein